MELAGSLKHRPAVFPANVMYGVSCVVTPRIPTTAVSGAVPTVIVTQGEAKLGDSHPAVSQSPVSEMTIFDEMKGKSAWVVRLINVVWLQSNSWFPNVAAW